MELKLIGKTMDGIEVFDRPNSHSHCSTELVAEALKKINSHGIQFLVEQVEFNREIGSSNLIPTTTDFGGDEIIYARRKGRKGFTRFVKGKSPSPSKSVVVILKKCSEGFYLLITAFIGEKSFPEPWDPKATPEAVEFWKTHALIWGSEALE